MSDPITPAGLAAALIKLLLAALPSAIGSALSLHFNTRALTFKARALAFSGSFGLAWYVGEALGQHYALTGPLLDGAKLLLGLFGLNLIASINTEIPTLITAARRRLLGDEA